MRVAVLLNAGAGALRNGKTEQSLELLKTALRDRGVSANFESCAGEELRSAAERALQAARTGKIDAVVVGGGDGSIRTVASVFAGTDVPLGVLPLGTLNHFAKDLGIPTDPQAAAEVIAAGKTRNVDTAQVNGLTFVNNSSIGIYPYLVIDRERRQARHGYSKWVA
ncbi:MAG: hypothetical protein QOD74_39, partial [Variibacter sp.]|nr:hypothetical protein [Variibacter sp.]